MNKVSALAARFRVKDELEQMGGAYRWSTLIGSSGLPLLPKNSNVRLGSDLHLNPIPDTLLHKVGSLFQPVGSQSLESVDQFSS